MSAANPFKMRNLLLTVHQSAAFLRRSALYKFVEICTMTKIFSAISFLVYPASFSGFFARSPEQFTSLKGGLYGYVADRYTSNMRAWNASLSSVQGFRAGSERRIFDLSDLQLGDYTPGAFARDARGVYAA